MWLDNREHIVEVVLAMIYACWFDVNFHIISVIESIGIINLEIK